MQNFDVLIVGCGLSGAVVARELAECNKKVLILERRNHIAGNMYDYVDDHGILVHKYGPHTFHTTQKRLYDYVCKYGEWEEYKLTCGAEINGICTPTPFNFTTVDDFYPKDEAERIKKRLLEVFPGRTTVTVVEMLNSEDKTARDYATFLFENDYSLYTAKQWGVSAKEIDPSVLKRVPLRLGYETGYFEDEYQVMPKTNYVDFFKSILNHKNIEIQLESEALNSISIKENKLYFNGKLLGKPLIYTGAIDELFGLKYGQLPYRSLRFEWKYEEIDSKQDMPVVAYPQAEGYTRIVEFKKLPVQDVRGTSYEVEYPLTYSPDKKQEPYYPVLTEESQCRYKKYVEESEKISNLFLCGRLGDFKYYNMDQALDRALSTAEKVKAFFDQTK